MAQARLFQALSDPTRLKIVGILAEGPLNVTGIVNLVRAAQPAVSRHLRILREVGLIHDRRLGKEVEYSLDGDRVRETCGWLGEFARGGGSGARRAEAAGSVARGDTARAGAGSDPGEGTLGPAAQTQAGQRQVRDREEVGKRAPAPGSGGGTKGRRKRVSPLAARGGIAGVPGGRGGIVGEQEPPEKAPAGQDDARSGGSKTAASARDGAIPEKPAPGRGARRVKGAGIRSSGGKRRKGPARRKHPSAAGGKGGVKREPDTEPAYVVEREEDSMDDFLL